MQPSPGAQQVFVKLVLFLAGEGKATREERDASGVACKVKIQVEE